MRYRPFVVVVSALAVPQLMAQDTLVDIGLFDIGNSQLEVRLITDSYFDAILASSVFTIRWETASGANLGNDIQSPAFAACHSISKSGVEEDDQGYRYQRFAGFGFSTMADEGIAFQPFTELVLCTIPYLNGVSLFEIVNDPWTAINNGDYYLSLGGANKTGIIYDNPSLIVDGTSPSGSFADVQPNPTNGLTRITFGPGADVEMSLADPLGRIVWNERLAALGAARQQEIDLTGFAKGTYLLQLNSVGRTESHRLVVQ